MADGDKATSSSGERMLVMTDMLTPPKELLELKVIPRTVEWVQVGYMAVCAIVLTILQLIILGFSTRGTLYALVLGIFVGYALSSWEPIKGESFGTWVGLTSRSALSRKVKVGNRRAKLYAGLRPLPRTALGKVQLLPSGVEVAATDFDERGYPIFSTSVSSKELVQRSVRLPKAAPNKLKASSQVGNLHTSRSISSRKRMPALPPQGKSSRGATSINRRKRKAWRTK